jgi:hypothetical protein
MSQVGERRLLQIALGDPPTSGEALIMAAELLASRPSKDRTEGQDSKERPHSNAPRALALDTLPESTSTRVMNPVSGINLRGRS